MAKYFSPQGITPFPQGKFVTGCMDLMSKKTKDGLLVRLFYPTTLKNVESHSSRWTPWYLGDSYSTALAKMFLPHCHVIYRSLISWQTSSSFVPSVWEGPFAGTKFPVVVFSHGWCAHRSMYSTVCSDLSSHGFIVASIEHRDGSACTTFTLSDKGEKVWHDCERIPSGEKEYPIRARQVRIRAKECSRALDLFQDLNVGEVTNELKSDFDLSVFKNNIDISAPLLIGHSFGGTAVILALANDQRFKLGVGLDPWMLPLKEDLENIKVNLKQPFLSILMEGFLSEANLSALEKMNSDNTQNILIRGTVHQNQSDIPFVTGIVGQFVGGYRSKMDRHLAMAINNQLVINFICNNLGFVIEKPKPEVNNIVNFCSFGTPPKSLNRDESMAYLQSKKILNIEELQQHQKGTTQFKSESKL